MSSALSRLHPATLCTRTRRLEPLRPARCTPHTSSSNPRCYKPRNSSPCATDSIRLYLCRHTHHDAKNCICRGAHPHSGLHHDDYRQYLEPAMGQLQSQRRARILVRPAQSLLRRHGHLRALPQDERLRKGPVLLQHVANSRLPDLVWRRRRAVRHRVLCRHHLRRGPAPGRRLAGRCWRTVFQRHGPVRRHGYSGLPLRPRLALLVRLAPRPLVVSLHRQLGHPLPHLRRHCRIRLLPPRRRRLRAHPRRILRSARRSASFAHLGLGQRFQRPGLGHAV